MMNRQKEYKIIIKFYSYSRIRKKIITLGLRPDTTRLEFVHNFFQDYNTYISIIFCNVSFAGKGFIKFSF